MCDLCNLDSHICLYRDPPLYRIEYFDYRGCVELFRTRSLRRAYQYFYSLKVLPLSANSDFIVL